MFKLKNTKSFQQSFIVFLGVFILVSCADEVTDKESDTISPVITLNGESTVTLVQGTTYEEAGASATDDVDGNVSVTTTGAVDVNTPNSYTITYTATDSTNNSSTAIRTVIIVTRDTTPPVITLNGASIVTLVQGTAYFEAGAIATDDVDGGVSVTTTGTVDVATPNTYTITYTATDSMNNVSTAIRTVIIVTLDTASPVITLNGEGTITLAQGTAYVEAGASATDNIDGNVDVTTTGRVDVNTPGNYIITYTATDSVNNTGTASRIVIVVTLDITPPVITINGATTITLVQGTAYVEAGASAIDNIDGSVNVTITGSIDINTPNTYTITYTATDSANNTAITTKAVIIVALDTTQPVITLNGARTITLIQGAAYVEAGASARDDVDGTVAVTTTGSVDTNTPGNYTITYTATDSANNTAVVVRTVVIEIHGATLGRNVTLPHIESFDLSSSIDDLANATVGGVVTWEPNSGWQGGGAVKMVPPLNEGYSALGQIYFGDQTRVNVRWLMKFGRTYQGEAARNKLIVMNRTDSQRQNRPLIISGVYDVNGVIHRYWRVSQGITTLSGPFILDVEELNPDAVFTVGTGYNTDEWVAFEYEVDLIAGRLNLYINTADGRYSGLYATTDMTQTESNPASNPVSLIQCLGCYFEVPGREPPFFTPPYTDTNYFMLDELVISNDGYIGPPNGFSNLPSPPP